MIYTHPISEERSLALRERGLDGIHNALVSGGCIVDGVALSLDPPSVKVEWTGGVSPEMIFQGLTFPHRRNRVAAESALRTFVSSVDAGLTPTPRQIAVALRSIVTILDLD